MTNENRGSAYNAGPTGQSGPVGILKVQGWELNEFVRGTTITIWNTML